MKVETKGTYEGYMVEPVEVNASKETFNIYYDKSRVLGRDDYEPAAISSFTIDKSDGSIKFYPAVGINIHAKPASTLAAEDAFDFYGDKAQDRKDRFVRGILDLLKLFEKKKYLWISEIALGYVGERYEYLQDLLKDKKELVEELEKYGGTLFEGSESENERYFEIERLKHGLKLIDPKIEEAEEELNEGVLELAPFILIILREIAITSEKLNRVYGRGDKAAYHVVTVRPDIDVLKYGYLVDMQGFVKGYTTGIQSLDMMKKNMNSFSKRLREKEKEPMLGFVYSINGYKAHMTAETLKEIFV